MHSFNTHTGADQKHKRIKLNPKEWAELRKQVWKSQHGLCADCGRWVRLDGDTIFNTAHLCHIRGRGIGGDDIKSNVEIKCYACHIILEHGPQWSGGK